MLNRLQARIAKGSSEGGFTLIELLVVIIIIGILLAIAVPSYLGFRTRANNAAAQSNVRAAVPAVEAYYADNGTYDNMSIGALRAIDPAVKVTVDAAENSASTYCIYNSTPVTPTFMKRNPGGDITSGNCALSAADPVV